MKLLFPILWEIHTQSEANFADLYSHLLLQTRRVVIFFKKKNACGFYLHKHRKWNIPAMKNFVIKIKKGWDWLIQSLNSLTDCSSCHCNLSLCVNQDVISIVCSDQFFCLIWGTRNHSPSRQAESRHPLHNFTDQSTILGRKAGELAFLISTEGQKTFIPWDNYCLTHSDVVCGHRTTQWLSEA